MCDDQIDLFSCQPSPLRVCFENHAGLLAKRLTMSRIIASCSRVSLVHLPLIVLAQAPLPPQPAECTLHNPAPWSHDKPALVHKSPTCA